MRVLVFDNYDSFTYNLVHILEDLLQERVDVFRNDQIALGDIARYDKIVLSPGPGIPSEAGSLLDVIREYAPSKSILGVCLGHQAIGEVFGGKLVNLSTVYHGVATPVTLLTDDPLFNGLPRMLDAGRYHSWILDKEDLPEDLTVTAEDENGYIMALRHKRYDVAGVQFHPESVLTPQGRNIIANWLKN